MGSAGYAKEQAQALANKCVAVAEARKDAVAFISPYRGAAITDATSQTDVQVRSDDDITDNVLSFYAPITSSSYAVFDSGYKYMFDRFANTFRYVPLNGDIAGFCARNDANQLPMVLSCRELLEVQFLMQSNLHITPVKYRETDFIRIESTQ